MTKWLLNAQGQPNIIEPRAILQGTTVLVAALAWNEFGRRTLEKLKPAANPGYTMLWAITVSIVLLILISVWNKAAEIQHLSEGFAEDLKSGVRSQRLNPGSA